MWLRWVVCNLLNHVAEDKVRRAAVRARDVLQGKSALQPPISRDGSGGDVVLMFALGLESGAFVDRMENVVTTECPAFVERVGDHLGQRIMVVESGVGRRAAIQATEDVIKIHRPQWIVSAGFAGALVPELHRGHVLMADSIVDARHQPLAVGFDIDSQVLSQTPSLHVGRLLTLDQLIRLRDEKQRLAVDFDAAACDMETMGVAEVCRRHQTRFLSVRVISDGLDDPLPAEVEHMLDQHSFAGKFGAATRAVFQRPGSLKDMWNLRELAQKASERLAKFLAGVLPQLATTQENRESN